MSAISSPGVFLIISDFEHSHLHKTNSNCEVNIEILTKLDQTLSFRGNKLNFFFIIND